MSSAWGTPAAASRAPIGTLVLVALAAGLASWPVFVRLDRADLVTGDPLLLALLLPLIGLLGTRPVQEVIGGGSLVNRATLRLVLAFALFSVFTWTAGWSLVLPAAAILVAVVHIQRSGSRVWRPAVLVVTAATLAGQTGVALGWVSTVAAPAVSHLAATSILVLACLGLVAVGASVAERDAAGQALARSDARLRALMESSTDVLTVSDAGGLLRYVSPAVTRSLGYYPRSLLGTPLLDLVDPEHRAEVAARMAQVTAAGAGTRARLDVLVALASHERRWHEWTLHNLLDEPLVEGMVVEQRDVTDRRRHQDALAHAAAHDELTGLPNRGDLLRRLAVSLSEVGASSGLAVLFLDLDRFKPVNDTHGHAAGDEVLVALSRRLRAGLRPHDHLARISGDEFCAILTEVNDRGEVDAVVERLERLVAQPVALDAGATVQVGVSIGVALTFDARRTPESLFAAADAAMYTAKRQGRARGAPAGRATPPTARDGRFGDPEERRSAAG
ncbi:MAG TPA: sensor domain-containing diguanylate cyclase [Actinotalea sp.]|nr:sensor domain-containing diguanylate cyclase [Actinotalea sp.]